MSTKPIRKQIVPTLGEASGLEPSGIVVAEVAEVFVTSEAPEHPVDHIFDARRGQGGTRWMAAVPGDQTLILAFEPPQSMRKIVLEVEESGVDRTQEVTIALSQDGGQTYRELLRQEYTFSPSGTTFEREDWVIHAADITHLRIWIRPDKGGKPTFATITSLRIE
jgi:hypothetical protein